MTCKISSHFDFQTYCCATDKMKKSDLKALCLSLLFGNICGSLFIIQFFPLSRLLNYPIQDGWINGADILAEMVSAISLYVAPAVVTTIARRRKFLWGFLPVACFDIWDVVGTVVSSSTGWQLVESGFLELMMRSIVAVVLTSGPISLYLHVIANRLASERRNEKYDQNVPAPGSWPPAPKAPDE